MSIRVDTRNIADTLKYWDDNKTKAYLDSIRVEIRRDLRKCPKNDVPILESIIEQLDTKEFWVMLDYMTSFSFTP